jgi:acyl carrier protein
LYLAPGHLNDAMTIEEIAKDSMDVVELIAVLGDTYRVSIEPSKMNHIKTVGDIIDFVFTHQGSAAGKSGMETF